MKRGKATRRRYLQIEADVYNCPAFRTLPPSALKLWFDMRVQFNGSNNGNISAAMSILVHRNWSSPDTLHRALRELIERGLIVRTRQGRPGPFRIASLYAFADLPVARNEALFIEGRDASEAYLDWRPSAVAKKMRATKSIATPIRKSYGYRYENRNDIPDSGTESVVRKNAPVALWAAPVAESSHAGVHERQHYENRSALYIPVHREAIDRVASASLVREAPLAGSGSQTAQAPDTVRPFKGAPHHSSIAAPVATFAAAETTRTLTNEFDRAKLRAAKRAARVARASSKRPTFQ